MREILRNFYGRVPWNSIPFANFGKFWPRECLCTLQGKVSNNIRRNGFGFANFAVTWPYVYNTVRRYKRRVTWNVCFWAAAQARYILKLSFVSKAPTMVATHELPVTDISQTQWARFMCASVSCNGLPWLDFVSADATSLAIRKQRFH